MTTQKIKDFTDLIAWQEGHKLALYIYQITNKFPASETYALMSQMRRAAISITSNIAEGFARQSSKEHIQFYYITLGSITELQSQLMIARDVRYISTEEFGKTIEMTSIVQKLTNGLVRSIKSRA